jgi:endonuclease/exonuclease/phosphatase family metal-dependent hydrolase
MGTRRIRLMTFNIAHGRGLNPIQGLSSARRIRSNLLKVARLITHMEADMVALQEIDQHSRWAGNFDHSEYLRQHAHMAHSAFGVNTRRDGLFNLRYGNATLSRMPIIESHTVVFGRSRIGEKGFLCTEVDFDGKIIPLVNLHLHYRSRDQRLRQLDRLTDWLRSQHADHGARWSIPPIVCGDFNATNKASDATASLLSHLHDFGDYSCHPVGENTFPSPWPSRTLDFVFLPSQCHHARSVVVNCMISDHRPVLVEFDV